MQLMDTPDRLSKLRTFEIFDDFEQLDNVATTGKWVVTGIGTEVVTLETDERNGILDLTTQATTPAANDSLDIKTTNAVFLMAAGSSLECVGRIQLNEATVNDAALFFGFLSSPAANGGSIQNGALLMEADFDGAGIFKPAASRNFQAISSLNTVQTLSTSTAQTPLVADVHYITYRVLMEVETPTRIGVTYYLDLSEANVITAGVPIKGSPRSVMGWEPLLDNTTKNRIKHTITLTGTIDPMHLIAILKTSAAAQQTIQIDFLGGWQTRI